MSIEQNKILAARTTALAALDVAHEQINALHAQAAAEMKAFTSSEPSNSEMRDQCKLFSQNGLFVTALMALERAISDVSSIKNSDW